MGRMGLSDLSGAYLGRAMKNNRSVVKLDMGGNLFGPKTCRALAESLEANDTVRHVNLELNSLVKDEEGKHDVSGVVALAKMLKVNRTLQYLNLYRCNVQSEGGHALVQGLAENETLIFLEVGNNGLGQPQMRRMAARLDENRARYERNKEEEGETRRIMEAEAKERKAREDEMEKKENLKQWMADQKVLRAVRRREEMEERAEKERAEAQRLREEEEERRKKEAAAKEAKKKKKKGKKK